MRHFATIRQHMPLSVGTTIFSARVQSATSTKYLGYPLTAGTSLEMVPLFRRHLRTVRPLPHPGKRWARVPLNRRYIVKDGAIIPPAPAYRSMPLPPPARQANRQKNNKDRYPQAVYPINHTSSTGIHRYTAENSRIPRTSVVVRTGTLPGSPSGLWSLSPRQVQSQQGSSAKLFEHSRVRIQSSKSGTASRMKPSENPS
nr:hypothetical protein Iba_scaffold11353CG0110 [Ipomoea batatas]